MRADAIDPAATNPFTRARYWERIGARYAKAEPLLLVKHYAKGVVYLFTNMATGYYANMIHHHPGRQIASAPTDPDSSSAHRVMQWLARKTPTELALGMVIGVYLLLSYGCTLTGLAVAWRERRSALLLLSFVIAAYFVLITGTAGVARFKLPAIPFYLSFAGLGARWIRFHVHSRG
jgi:hypothetical protein